MTDVPPTTADDADGPDGRDEPAGEPDAARPMNRAPLFLLYLNVLVVATCGLVYELLAGTLASYVLGDSVTQFSLVIGVYLFALGVGAWLSGFVRDREARTFVEVELAVALLGGLSAPLLFLSFAHLGPFRVVLFGVVFGIGTLVGLELPLLMRILRAHLDFEDLVSRVLAFDYVGALAASLLFPIFLVPYLGLVRTSLVFGLLNALVGLWGTYLLRPALAGNVAGLRGRAVLVIGLLAAGLIKADRLTHLAEEGLFVHPIVYARTTPYQRIVVTRGGTGFQLFLSGNLQFSSTDEYRYHEALVHPALSLAEAPRRVLVLGGGDGLAVREILKHPGVESVTLVDLDPEMTDLSRRFPPLEDLNGGALRDRRVRVVNRDAFLWLEEPGEPFDAAVIDFPDPNGFSLGKLYTTRFYRLLAARLTPEAAVGIQCTSPFVAPSSYWCVVRTMEASGFAVAPYHAPVPSFGVWGFALARRSPFEPPRRLPDGLAGRLKFLDDRGLAAMFDLPADLKPVPVEINRLDNQRLVRYYEREVEAVGLTAAATRADHGADHDMGAMTRRDVLAAFLGLPAATAALAAGCSRPPALPPSGGFVGPSVGFGHRLRDGLRPRPADDAWRKVGVAVVGGGVAGLSAAWRLKRAGYDDFVLLELEPRPGGTAVGGGSAVTPFPWGAHYLPLPTAANGPLVTLLDEAGVLEGATPDGEPVAAEQFLCRDPEERLFFGGRWSEGLYPYEGATAADLSELAAFEREVGRWAAWRDGRGRRAFAVPAAFGSDDAEVVALDRVTMSDWLDRRGWRSGRLRWVVDYACRDDYGLRAEQTSAWAGLFYFASRLRGPGEASQPFLTWPEGNGRLVAHLARSAEGKMRLGQAAAEVVPVPRDGSDAADVIATDAGGRAAGYRAGRVIFAAPQFLAPHLIRGYRKDRGGAAAAFEYGSWLVANLSLAGRPRETGFPLAWDNVLYDSPSLGYVAATHQRGPDHGPTVFTYYYALCDDRPAEARSRLLSLDWADWADVAVADLEAAHPEIRSLTTRLDAMRWGHAMIRPRPGFVWGRERREAARPYRGVHFANADLSGVALFEEAFYHGVCAAEEALAALRRPVEPLYPERSG